jgi:hypothetical protein
LARGPIPAKGDDLDVVRARLGRRPCEIEGGQSGLGGRIADGRQQRTIDPNLDMPNASRGGGVALDVDLLDRWKIQTVQRHVDPD